MTTTNSSTPPQIGDGKFNTDDVIDYPSIEVKAKQFEGLINSINTSTDKKKALWLEIYQNAITDRMHAYMLYCELYLIVKGNSSQHAMQGQNINKAIERMSKATDQLIKLAEIIANSEMVEAAVDASVSPDDIYSKIKG